MDVTDHEPLYPHHGAPYYAAMAEAVEEFETWEAQREKLGGGIQIFNTKELEDEDG